MKAMFCYFFGISLLILVSSCVRDVVLDAKEKPQVVVDCVLSDDDVQELHLMFTKGASRKEAEPLTEAVATLIDKTESKTVGQFRKSGDGDLWTLDYTPVQYHEYRLEVQVPGYDLIYAEDTMPAVMNVESYTYTEDLFDQTHTYGPIPSFTKLSFFAGTIYRVNLLPEFTLIYGMNYNGQTGKHEIADDIFTNLPYVDNFNARTDKYMPVLDKWEDEYNPLNHIALKSLYLDLKGAYKHNQYLVIEKAKVNEIVPDDDKLFYAFAVFGSFTGDWYYYKNIKYREPTPTEGYLVFESLSENYHTYLRESLRFKQIKESTDMSSIYLRDNIYTNIVGGLGIFAACSRQIQQCANNFKTGIFDVSFSDYDIVNEKGEYVFSNDGPYDYPLLNQ